MIQPMSVTWLARSSISAIGVGGMEISAGKTPTSSRNSARRWPAKSISPLGPTNEPSTPPDGTSSQSPASISTFCARRPRTTPSAQHSIPVTPKGFTRSSGRRLGSRRCARNQRYSASHPVISAAPNSSILNKFPLNKASSRLALSESHMAATRSRTFGEGGEAPHSGEPSDPLPLRGSRSLLEFLRDVGKAVDKSYLLGPIVSAASGR